MILPHSTPHLPSEVAEKWSEIHRRGTEDAENLIAIALKTLRPPSLRWKLGFLALLPRGRE